VSGVAYSPDGSRIASSSYDATVRVWDAASGKQIGQQLIGHTNVVSSVAFSPDGTVIASGGDSTVRLWPGYADASTVCAKLSSNISDQQWRDWVSPDIGYIDVCPDLPPPADH
jgi:WD40 repeat protein